MVAGWKNAGLRFKSFRQSGYLDKGCEIGTRYTITIFPCFPGRAILHGLIASPTGLSRQHEDDLLLFIDFIEEPVGADPVAPRLRLVASELPDIFPEIGLRSQSRIDVFAKLFRQLLLPRPQFALSSPYAPEFFPKGRSILINEHEEEEFPNRGRSFEPKTRLSPHALAL
jgi:hypothetical protein